MRKIEEQLPEFSVQLKRFRQDKGITRTKLAELCQDDSITTSEISCWELGREDPKAMHLPIPNHAQALARVFDLSGAKRILFIKAAADWKKEYIRKYRPEKHEMLSNRAEFDDAIADNDTSRESAKKLVARLVAVIERVVGDPASHSGNLLTAVIKACGFYPHYVAHETGTAFSNIPSQLKGKSDLGPQHAFYARTVEFLRLEQVGVASLLAEATNKLNKKKFSKEVTPEKVLNSETVKKGDKAKSVEVVDKVLAAALESGRIKSIRAITTKYGLSDKYFIALKKYGAPPTDPLLVKVSGDIGLDDDYKVKLRLVGFRGRGNGETIDEIFMEAPEVERGQLVERLRLAVGTKKVHMMLGFEPPNNRKEQRNRDTATTTYYNLVIKGQADLDRDDVRMMCDNLFSHEDKKVKTGYTNLLLEKFGYEKLKPAELPKEHKQPKPEEKKWVNTTANRPSTSNLRG